jgi:hypothetical protein
MLRLVRQRGTVFLGVMLLTAQLALAWGHEGHQVIGLIAEHYMTPDALVKASTLLDAATIDSIASWADDYRHDHPETTVALHRHSAWRFDDRHGQGMPEQPMRHRPDRPFPGSSKGPEGR